MTSMTVVGCSVDGCDRPKYCKGYCKRHYQQQWSHNGDPTIIRPNAHGTPEERFWAKVPTRPVDGCWEWTGHKDKDGYGTLRVGNTQVRAHRFSYELVNGALDGLGRHRCDNPGCVNPQHIEPGTHQDNMDDRMAAGHYAPKTHCKWGHEFTPDNTAVYSGQRYCRACIHRRASEQRQRRLAAAS